ncbi:MAG: T9SS type A sorting domain-containing protein [Lishizhenia sp.]
MIKNLLLLTALISSAFAFSQKDIAVIMNTPADGSTVQSNADVSLSFTIENSGTTDLIATDSVFYTLGINNAGNLIDLFGGLLLADRTDAVVTPGSAWDVDFVVPQVIFDGLQFQGGNLEGNLSLCLVAVLYEGTTLATEDSETNNFSCNTILFVADYASIEENNESSVSVFPNPASNLVTISTAVVGNKTLVVRDLSGKVVANQTFGTNETKLDVSNLNSGIYIYTLTAGEVTIASDKLMVK